MCRVTYFSKSLIQIPPAAVTENAEIVTTFPPQSPRPLAVALAYNGLCTFEFGIAVEVFGLPRPERGAGWYRFAVAAVEDGELRATGGVRLLADGGYPLIAEANTLIIPGWRGIDADVPPALCAALRDAHARGCRIIALCSGAFVLAAAGLLDGHRATTHWRYTRALEERYPTVEVVEDALYVGDEKLMTSAGSAAGIDLCLHVVRSDFGLEAANCVARRLVIQPHRDGDQSQNVARPVARCRESRRMGQLFDWLHHHIGEPHTLASLAVRVSMSPRTLLRRFEEATGMTPARWLMEERLRRAAEQLLDGRENIERIAQGLGFGSASILRQRFRQRYGVSPSQYRKNGQKKPPTKSAVNACMD